MGPQDEDAERLIGVHHVEERKAGVRPGCRQDLEKRSVRMAGWISAAGAPVMTGPQPRFDFRQDLRLNAALYIERAGAMLLRAPTAGLPCAPEQQIESSGRCSEGMQGVAAESVDPDIAKVRAAHCERTVVGFQDVPPIVVFDGEESRVRVVTAFAPLARVGGVAEAGAVPAPAVGLKDTARGNGGDE